ncbi:MAG: OmpH family outer membrane protein [Gammaproteobacteria bacterium]
MNIKKVVWAMVILGMAATSSVQAAEAKFAFVDVQKIFAEANAAKAAQTSLRQKEGQYKKELEAKGSSLQKLIEALQDPKVADADRAEKANEIRAKREEFQKTATDYEKRLNDERNSVSEDILKAIKQASQDIAKEKGYTAVLSSNQGLYYDNELDITADTLARVNDAAKP